MKPARRLAKILLNAEPAGMDRTHVELARQIALLSRETGPFERLAIIDRHALAVNIKAAERCLRGGITSLGGQQSGSMLRLWRNDLSRRTPRNLR